MKSKKRNANMAKQHSAAIGVVAALFADGVRETD